MTNPNLGQPVKNKNKVQLKQWRKWSNHAKKVFNDMFESLRPRMQQYFLHPDARPQISKHWATTRWNVAWTAACVANKEGYLGKVVMVEGKNYREAHKPLFDAIKRKKSRGR